MQPLPVPKTASAALDLANAPWEWQHFPGYAQLVLWHHALMPILTCLLLDMPSSMQFPVTKEHIICPYSCMNCPVSSYGLWPKCPCVTSCYNQFWYSNNLDPTLWIVTSLRGLLKYAQEIWPRSNAKRRECQEHSLRKIQLMSDGSNWRSLVQGYIHNRLTR